ncbi:hydrogenase expression/formation protein HypE [Pseudomonas sp. SBB6]|uniref:hydrogenase expression/formation protein HypE n=1 Tax=Pseudomonas sp. SBB6 TaxID=2962032 RepID=UPI0020B8BFFE|nr:hydrogenase expression/formation protein HypE [Pseudomonas sp. SBB6]
MSKIINDSINTAVVSDVTEIQLDHGTGAKLSRELVGLIVDELGDVYIGKMEDSAVLDLDCTRIAVTTDSFVVAPYIFGNGDIGKIAVCGTVNDLAVVGATPVYLTLALILEVGFPIVDLKKILRSIRRCALEAGVKIVAGDTKVVGKGEADGIFINTTGVGVVKSRALQMSAVKPGDNIIVSGFLGNHTVHLLSIREGLGFETRVLSDCAVLNNAIASLMSATKVGAVRSMRDVTRGGLSAVLHEYAAVLNRTIVFEERLLPIQHETLMATDMLGVNPLNLANEGCLCIFVSPEETAAVMEVLKGINETCHASVIGRVTDVKGSKVQMLTSSGNQVEIEELIGAELPRLC